MEKNTFEMLEGFERKPETFRWVASRKKALLLAVRRGEITALEACDRYKLSIEELICWSLQFDRAGQNGLSVYRGNTWRSGKGASNPSPAASTPS